jgi:hypothetical protein
MTLLRNVTSRLPGSTTGLGKFVAKFVCSEMAVSYENDAVPAPPAETVTGVVV